MSFEDLRDELRLYNINTMSKHVAMALQDELPEQWRILIYKYGQGKVFSLIKIGYNINEAVEILRTR